jgi:hypothetical protein
MLLVMPQRSGNFQRPGHGVTPADKALTQSPHQVVHTSDLSPHICLMLRLHNHSRLTQMASVTDESSV